MKSAVGRLLEAPLFSGPSAILAGIVAVGIPTSIRGALYGVVTGCEFTPYLPFVLLPAIFLGWRAAVLVVIASIAILGGLFSSGAVHEHMTQACFLSAAGVFLGSSAVIIGTVAGIRYVLANLVDRSPDDGADGIIFSLDKGQVWASWNGSSAPVRLGSKKRVGLMMEDYLAQVKVGERLTGESD